jgi:hypothetical protein
MHRSSQPQPFCAIHQALLPLLHSEELSAKERESLEAHLTDCTWCQRQLAAYDIVDAALRRHYAADRSADTEGTEGRGMRDRQERPLTLENIVQTSKWQAARRNTSAPLSALPLALQHRTAPLRRFGPLAAVLVFTVLAASLFGYFGGHHPAPSNQPPLDPTTQAYLSLLDRYYIPWVLDYRQQSILCGPAFAAQPAALQSQHLPECRPILVPELAAGETLSTQLAMAHAPTSWQTAHAALRQAMEDADAYDTQRLQAIDAHNVTLYGDVSAHTPEESFCMPVNTFNALLLSRGAALLPLPTSNCTYDSASN